MSGHDALQQAIERANQQFMEAFGRGDMAGLARLYTEDAHLMPPGMPAMRGRAAIQQFWQGAAQLGIHAVELRTDEVQPAGETACEIGQAVLHIRSEDGQETTDTAKYVVVWAHQGGGWKLAVDIWNSNA